MSKYILIMFCRYLYLLKRVFKGARGKIKDTTCNLT